MEAISSRRLPNGLGVDFDDDLPTTGVRVAYKGAVLEFRCVARKPLSNASREGICAFLTERGHDYFADDGKVTSAGSASVLVNDLIKAGLAL